MATSSTIPTALPYMRETPNTDDFSGRIRTRNNDPHVRSGLAAAGKYVQMQHQHYTQHHKDKAVLRYHIGSPRLSSNCGDYIASLRYWMACINGAAIASVLRFIHIFLLIQPIKIPMVFTSHPNRERTIKCKVVAK
jgi:hypothetical protein